MNPRISYGSWCPKDPPNNLKAGSFSAPPKKHKPKK